MNLRKIGAIVVMELKSLVREPANLFMMLIFPAVLTLTFGIAFADIPGMSFTDMVPGLYAYACIFMIMIVSMSFTTLRQEGLLRRLNTTPLSSEEFMGGNVISNMITAIIQMVIVTTIAVLLGFRPAPNILGFVIAFSMILLFSLCTVGLGLITATIAKSPEAATGISFIFILPMMFFGTFIPITDTTRPIAMCLPSYYVTDGLASIFGGAPLTNFNIMLDLIVVTIMSIIIIVLGVLIFKKRGTTE